MSYWSTPQTRTEILAGHRSGATVSALAREFGFSRQGIYNMIGRARLDERRAEQRHYQADLDERQRLNERRLNERRAKLEELQTRQLRRRRRWF